MRGSIFPKLYRLAVGDSFGISALLYPLQQYLELGDYGLYRHGAFVRVGNLLDEFELSLSDCLDKRQGNSLSDLLIHTANGKCHFQGPSIDSPLPLLEVEFARGHGMVAQFRNRYSEQLNLNQTLADCIKILVHENRWDPAYRLVWQRDVAKQWHCAWTQSPGGKVVLWPDAYHWQYPIACQSYDIAPLLCRNINITFWQNNFPITPAVNFARYCKDRIGLCSAETHDGIDLFMDLGSSDPDLFLDNS